MEENAYVILDADTKEYTLENLKKVYSALSHLYGQIKGDRVERSLVNAVLGLSESIISDIGKRLDYNGTLQKEMEKRYGEIRKANLRIRELEEMVGSSKPIDGLKEQVKYLCENVEKFWQEQGFGRYIREFQITKYGGIDLKLSFGFDTMSSLFHDEKPVSRKEELAERIKSVQERGFELVRPKNESHYEMKDCDSNKAKLVEIIMNRFPSAKITKFQIRNHGGCDTELFVISEIEVYIRNMHELAE